MGEDKGEVGSGTCIRIDTGVHGRCSIVEVVLPREEVKKKGDISAPFFRFVKQKPTRQCLSGAYFRAKVGLCIETRVFRRYELAKERGQGQSGVGRGTAAPARSCDECIRDDK